MLLLSQTADVNMTIDRIVAYDFISLYSRHFDLAEINLHGDNEYGFSELSARRTVMQAALKELVLDGLAKAIRRKDGFCYEITDTGTTLTEVKYLAADVSPRYCKCSLFFRSYILCIVLDDTSPFSLVAMRMMSP